MPVARTLGVPALLADQRHEHHLVQRFAVAGVLVAARQTDEMLMAWAVANRHDQPAADRALLLERLGSPRAARRSDDNVERRGLRPAQRAVARPHVGIAVA